MATMLSINRTYKRHHQENPSSQLSRRAIEKAAAARAFTVVECGNRTLICYEAFNEWLHEPRKESHNERKQFSPRTYDPPELVSA